jgi:hypothetical protein
VSFLKKINGLLIPGGVIYLTVPANRVLWSVEDDYAGHYRRYTLKNLTGKLESAGFKVEYSTYYFSLLVLPILLFRVIPGRMGLRKKSSSEYIIREHRVGNKAMERMLNIYLQFERHLMRKCHIGLGSSCLVVARVEKKLDHHPLNRIGDACESIRIADEAFR